MPEIFLNRTTRMFTRKYLQSISGLHRNHSDSPSLNFFFPSLSLILFISFFPPSNANIQQPSCQPPSTSGNTDWFLRPTSSNPQGFCTILSLLGFFPAFTTLFFPSQFLAFSSPLSRRLFSEKPNSVPKISTPSKIANHGGIYLISNEHDFYGTSSKREWPQKMPYHAWIRVWPPYPEVQSSFYKRNTTGEKSDKSGFL